jgi:hypothetical protein
MSADERCEETRKLITELALGVADGEERARALEHLEDCPDCRLELERQSQIADELLTLAPEEEPPPGFELTVLGAIEPPAPPPRRRLSLRPVLAGAAAAVVLAAIAAGATQLSYRDDVRLADQYRAALAEANGTYFGARQLTDAAGRRAGVLFVYRGEPSWILVTIDPSYRGSVERAELVDRAGRRVALEAFRPVGGSWGGAIPIDLQAVAALHLVGGDGRTELVATL